MARNAASAEGFLPCGPELARVLADHERYVAGRNGGARAKLKGANLNRRGLANRILDEADLTGASLVGADLHGARLARASLYCTDLRRCNLRNSSLIQADVRGASFKGADLSFAVLDNADLRAGTMMVVRPESVSVVDHTASKAFGGVDFSNCSLRKTSFGKAQLDGANFNGAILVETNFHGAKLTDASFTGAVLMGVDISELRLPPETFADCVFDVGPEAAAKVAELKALIAQHQHWVISDGKDGTPAALDGMDLRPVHNQFAGHSLIGLSVRAVTAIGVDFSGCQLQGAKFDAADLRGANFTNADLSGASFIGAKMVHAKFDNAHLGSLHLRGGNVLAPNLLGADANADQFITAVLDETLATLGLADGATYEL